MVPALKMRPFSFPRFLFNLVCVWKHNSFWTSAITIKTNEILGLVCMSPTCYAELGYLPSQPRETNIQVLCENQFGYLPLQSRGLKINVLCIMWNWVWIFTITINRNENSGFTWNRLWISKITMKTKENSGVTWNWVWISAQQSRQTKIQVLHETEFGYLH